MTKEYKDGVDQFMKFVINHADSSSIIKCSFTKFINLSFSTHKVISEHLYFHRIDVFYTTQIQHREDDTPLPNVYVDIPFEFLDYDNGNTVDMANTAYKDCVTDPKHLKNLQNRLRSHCTQDAKISLSQEFGWLVHQKGKFGWSDTSLIKLLGILARLLHESIEITVSMCEAKNIMFALGLEFVKIDACSNDCKLHRKEYEGLSECPNCALSEREKNDGSVYQYRKGAPTKVLSYFLLIPRFKRMFQSSQTIKDSTWHTIERVDDGKL